MEISVKDLMDDNEMLSHIFLGCIPRQELVEIKEKYIGVDGEEINWQEKSVTIPVTMTIGGVDVNPKEFFDEWKIQMKEIVSKEATKLISDKIGSGKMKDLQVKLQEYEQVLNSWEEDINWDVENPFLK